MSMMKVVQVLMLISLCKAVELPLRDMDFYDCLLCLELTGGVYLVKSLDETIQGGVCIAGVRLVCKSVKYEEPCSRLFTAEWAFLEDLACNGDEDNVGARHCPEKFEESWDLHGPEIGEGFMWLSDDGVKVCQECQAGLGRYVVFGPGLESESSEGLCMTSLREEPCRVGRGLICPGDLMGCTGPFARRAHYFKKIAYGILKTWRDYDEICNNMLPDQTQGSSEDVLNVMVPTCPPRGNVHLRNHCWTTRSR
ncbi:hypothetical protein Fcan01_11208 [Folsomia candida]|uniref:Uncharacterized protein n=1 Tax=Folsomia candida TaxID=158441 RepID=A0A226E7Q1_FOLCA|nr:hypothetical protein Fcan01_11208 [Folsomia candida]